jgi:hypothetical protein
MLKTFAAAGLVALLALSGSVAFAQTDSASPMPDKMMSDKTMAPKKPMMKTKTPSDTMNGGAMQPKM